MLTHCSGVPLSAAIWSICFISGKDAILLQFSLLCSKVRLFNSTVKVFCKDIWKVGERIFFCLSLLSGCKGTICFSPSFLLRRNIFQLEWSFPQKGEIYVQFPSHRFTSCILHSSCLPSSIHRWKWSFDEQFFLGKFPTRITELALGFLWHSEHK